MKLFFYLGTILTLLLQAAIATPSRASTPDESESVLAVEVTIRYVDVDASGANDGSTWQDAFTSLQPALEAAASGEQIWVAAGTYLPTVEHCGSGDRFKSFQLKQGVALYGGFDPTSGDTAWEDRDVASHLTRLSGDIGAPGDAADNSYHVFCHPDDYDLDASAILDGFTITGGNANGVAPHMQGGGMYNDTNSPTLANVTFSGNTAYRGGGMFNYNESSPTLTDVTFSGNTAAYGGGMYNDEYCSPTLTHVTFSGNTADDGDGGGMRNADYSSPTLTDVTFSGNTASYDGGGMLNYNRSNPTLTHVTFSGNTAAYGGGMYGYSTSSPTLTDVTFVGNSARMGGGMYNDDSSSPTLIDVVFSGNTVTGEGGGMYNSNSSSPKLTNVTFAGNTANYGGGIQNSYSCSPTLTNVTFSGNTAALEGGGMNNYSYSSPTLTNAILWGNAPDQIVNADSSVPVVTYSDIQGGFAGTGNLDLDPKFYRAPSPGSDNVWGTPDDDYGVLRLQPTSPVIDAGINAAVPAGILTDLSGAPRFIDLPTIPDTGAGDPPLVDLGAYEAQITIPLHLPLILR